MKLTPSLIPNGRGHFFGCFEKNFEKNKKSRLILKFENQTASYNIYNCRVKLSNRKRANKKADILPLSNMSADLFR